MELLITPNHEVTAIVLAERRERLQALWVRRPGEPSSFFHMPDDDVDMNFLMRDLPHDTAVEIMNLGTDFSVQQSTSQTFLN